MFKGTNKIWKGLALLLVLCMLPTVALADGAATVAIKSANADVAANTVTVTAEIGLKDTDITILAYRSGTKVETGKPEMPAVDTVGDVKGLKDSVVYIDQETAVVDGEAEKSGKHTFTFIPRSVSGVGKYVNIFVGGENVNETAFVQLEMAVAAPKATLGKLYNGEKIVVNLEAPSTSTYDFAAWKADVESVTDAVKVNGTAVASYTIDADAKTLTINDTITDAITSISVAGKEYANIDAVTIPDGTWHKKEAGSIDLTEDKTIIVGKPATVTIAKDTESLYGDEWLSSVATAVIKIGDATVEAVSVDGNDLTFTCPVVASGKLTIEINNFEIATSKANIEAVTAATADKRDLEAKGLKIEYDGFHTEDPAYATADAEDQANPAMFGKAYVTLPETGVNGSALTWTVSIDGAAAVEAPAGKYNLERPASNSDVKSKKYDFKASVAGAEEAVIPTVTATKIGAALSASAENIEVLVADAYVAGKSLVVISGLSDDMNPDEKNMTIGEAKLYYNETKAKYYGVVDSTLAATKDAVASNVVFADGASEKIYFGVASADGTTPKAADYSVALKIYLKKTKVADLSPREMLAMDIANAEPDGSLKAADFSTSLKVYLKKIKVDEMPIYEVSSAS